MSALPLFPVTTVGSWPRPPKVAEAQRRFRLQRTDRAERDRIVDAEVIELLQLQQDLGCDIVTDGELRRDNFYSFVAEKLAGVRLMTLAEMLDVVEDKVGFERLLQTLDVPAYSISSPVCTGKIERRQPLAADDLRFVQASYRPAGQGHAARAVPPHQGDVRRRADAARSTTTKEALAEDVVALLRAELAELAAEGADFVQFDEPVLTEVAFAPGRTRTFMCAALAARRDPAEELEFAVSLINRVVEGVRDVRIGVHVCRGNWSRDETTLLSGGYQPLAPYLERLDVTQLVLEYATDRAGDLMTFGGKELGLGVVNPRTDTVESTAAIRAAVEEALCFYAPEPDLPESRLRLRHVREPADEYLGHRGSRKSVRWSPRLVSFAGSRWPGGRISMSLDGRKPATEDLSARMLRKILPAVGLWLFVLGSVWPVGAQRAGTFKGSSDDPAIGYSTTTTLNNAVVEVNKKLQDGTVQLRFDGRSGFLQSALEALQIPVDSQLLVFSRFSLQRKLINEQNPRALFFNDRVALGWVRGGDVLEVAAHDESAGVVFYTLEQRVDAATGPPQFKRAFECLGCHVTGSTLGVPGLLMFSTTRPAPSESSGLPRHIDHSDALPRRFGGWFVTGSTGSVQHMGNDMAALDGRSNRELGSVENLFDADGYPRALERYRCPPGVDAPGRNDEPPDTRRMGSTPRGVMAAPAVHADAWTGGTHRRGHGRHRERTGGLPAVHRRSETHRGSPGRIGLCGAVLGQRAARPEGPLTL